MIFYGFPVLGYRGFRSRALGLRAWGLRFYGFGF